MTDHLPSCCKIACEGCTEFARGAADERARIVAWLRDLKLYDYIAPTGSAKLPLSNAIERGEHSSDRQAIKSAGAGGGVSRNAYNVEPPEAPRSTFQPCGFCGAGTERRICASRDECKEPSRLPEPEAPRSTTCRDCGHARLNHATGERQPDSPCCWPHCRCLAYVGGEEGT